MPVRIRPNRNRGGANHYESLKVSEKAPLDVIKASYRALSMRWHPDKNPGDEHAAHMMRTLNEAYEVLSNPEKREAYDATLIRPREAATKSSNPPKQTPVWKSRKHRAFSFAAVMRSIRRYNPKWVLTAAVIVLAAFGAIQVSATVGHYLAKRAEVNASTSAHESNVVERTALPETQPQRPVLDPRFANPLNGQPWPKHASYLEGFEKLATDGYSSVTVDNSKNTSDVFLKLVSAENRQPSKVVRVCFVPARATFTFYRITPGRYELRYQEVEDGKCVKTEPFVLSQAKRAQGVECTQLRVPLYGLPGRSVTLLQSDQREFLAAAPTASR